MRSGSAVARGISAARVPGFLLALALLWVGCSLPTDESGDLQVTLSVHELLLVVGERRQLSFNVLGFDKPADVALTFSSSNPAVVRVDDGGVLLGVGRGHAEVEVSLSAFEGAQRDIVSVQVIDQVAFERVFPEHVRFGDVITIVGSALDPASLAALSVGGWPALVHSFVPAAFTVPDSRDTLRVWTPAPASESGSLVALHVSGGSANWPLTVDQFDMFEPNNVTPRVISGPANLTNPQLSFDPGDGFDWYRLQDLDGSFTIEVQLRLPLELVLGTVTLSAPRGTVDEAPDWSVSPAEEVRCRGLNASRPKAYFQDYDATEQVLWIPVMDPEFDSVDVSVEVYTPPADPVAYSITVRDGYVTPYPPDEFEPNNHCAQAHEVTDGFTGALSIDGPADDDWFRFTVTDVDHDFLARLQCIRCEEDHFVNISLFRDTSVGDPEAPDELPLLDNVWAGGSSPIQLSGRIPPGDYFLVVYNDFLEPLEELRFEVLLSPSP